VLRQQLTSHGLVEADANNCGTAGNILAT